MTDGVGRKIRGKPTPVPSRNVKTTRNREIQCGPEIERERKGLKKEVKNSTNRFPPSSFLQVATPVSCDNQSVGIRAGRGEGDILGGTFYTWKNEPQF